MPSKTHSFTNILKYGALSGAVLFALALGMFGARPQEAQKAEATPIRAQALSEGLCIALGSAFGGIDTVAALQGCQGASKQAPFQKLVACLENIKVNGAPVCPQEPSANTIWTRPDTDTFNGLDLDKNLIFDNGKYLIIAYVDDDFPVRFITEKGNFLTPGGVTTGQDYFCSPDNALLVGDDLDPDCDGDSSTIGDGVVVARLITTAADGNSGTFSVSAIQENVAFPIEMTLVGPPEKIVMTPLFGKDTIQTGATPATPGGTVNCNGTTPGLCQAPDSTDCNFEATADAVLGTVAQAEKTVIVAKALDVNDVEITGALITWHKAAGFPDNPPFPAANGTFALNRFKTGGVALPQTPTIDAQALGVGFPQFVCGGRETGTIDLVARFDLVLSSTADPDEHEEISINVIGPATDMTLVAEPAEIDCTGTNTSKVTATIVNGEGDPVANGLDVRFSVVALGTANPLIADSSLGVASTVVTPLSGAGGLTADGQPQGVTVNVSVRGQIDINEDIQSDDDPAAVEHQTWEEVNRSIIVRCSGGPPPPGTGGDSGAGGTAPPPPTGTITPPDTGSGGQSANGLSLMTLVGLVTMGVAALTGTRLAARNK